MKPGEEFIEQGLIDLSENIETIPALLVSIGTPRLRRIGLPVPKTTFSDPEHRRFRVLHNEDQDSAHSRYNALIRRLVSYERAAECEI